jgi:hypothetical protein
MRALILMILAGCGTAETGDLPNEAPLQEPAATPDRVPNTIGGKDVPTTPGGTNDTVGEARAQPRTSGMARNGSANRPAIVSVPVEGELPGVKGKSVARTPQEMIEAFTAKGGQPTDPAHERRVAQMFMDEEFDEKKFQEMKNMKDGDLKPDPNKYDDPRNYAQNQARKAKRR